MDIMCKRNERDFTFTYKFGVGVSIFCAPVAWGDPWCLNYPGIGFSGWVVGV